MEPVSKILILFSKTVLYVEYSFYTWYWPGTNLQSV